jgi:hypothetical protein
MTQDCFGHKPPRRLLRPSYSPEISPWDFYWLGTAKSTLIGPQIPDEVHLLDAVTEILNDISDAEMQCVF